MSTDLFSPLFIPFSRVALERGNTSLDRAIAEWRMKQRKSAANRARLHAALWEMRHWLDELAHVRDPTQRQRGVHLIVYQDALLNKYTFNFPPRHLTYLEAVFKKRWLHAR